MDLSRSPHIRHFSPTSFLSMFFFTQFVWSACSCAANIIPSVSFFKNPFCIQDQDFALIISSVSRIIYPCSVFSFYPFSLFSFLFFFKAAADSCTGNSPSSFTHLISLSPHSSTYLPRLSSSLSTHSMILNRPRSPSFLGMNNLSTSLYGWYILFIVIIFLVLRSITRSSPLVQSIIPAPDVSCLMRL